MILASGSPRRSELLSQLGVPFRVVVSGAPEDVEPGLAPEEQAVKLSASKARAVVGDHPHSLVIGADTIVVIEGELMGKPADDAEAAQMLRRLSGREHLVVTGITLIDSDSDISSQSAVTSRVRFRDLSDAEIAAYVTTGEPRDKAGAYAIQGLGGGLVAALDGCFANVVGLPVCEMANLLEQSGLLVHRRVPVCRRADGSPCPRLV